MQIAQFGYESDSPGTFSLAQRLLDFLVAMRLQQELLNRAILHEYR